eukprot:1625316-Amphidinium_carterae.1
MVSQLAAFGCGWPHLWSMIGDVLLKYTNWSAAKHRSSICMLLDKPRQRGTQWMEINPHFITILGNY